MYTYIPCVDAMGYTDYLVQHPANHFAGWYTMIAQQRFWFSGSHREIQNVFIKFGREPLVTPPLQRLAAAVNNSQAEVKTTSAK